LLRKAPANLPIKIAKWNDIQKQKQFIPEFLREFYDKVKCDGESASDQHEADSESEVNESIPSSSADLPIMTRQRDKSHTAVKRKHSATGSKNVNSKPSVKRMNVDKYNVKRQEAASQGHSVKDSRQSESVASSFSKKKRSAKKL